MITSLCRPNSIRIRKHALHQLYNSQIVRPDAKGTLSPNCGHRGHLGSHYFCTQNCLMSAFQWSGCKGLKFHKSAGSAKTTPQLHKRANGSCGLKHDPSVKICRGPAKLHGSIVSSKQPGSGKAASLRLKLKRSSGVGIHPCK